MANQHIKLRKLCICRSRVEDRGAQALARYFDTYDSLEHLEISSNSIRDNGAQQLAQSLLKHAQSGSLKHLKIDDNFYTTDDGRAALFTLLREAKNLEYLNVGGLNIEDEDHGRELMAAIQASKSKKTLKSFLWSYDAFEMDDLIKDFLAILGDKNEFPELNLIELAETMGKIKRRNKLRKQFKENGITLILSDRQIQKEEGSDTESEAESDESDGSD